MLHLPPTQGSHQKDSSINSETQRAMKTDEIRKVESQLSNACSPHTARQDECYLSPARCSKSKDSNVHCNAQRAMNIEARSPRTVHQDECCISPARGSKLKDSSYHQLHQNRRDHNGWITVFQITKLSKFAIRDVTRSNVHLLVVSS